MNLTDRMELDVLRKAMWEVFQKVARTPENDQDTERFVSFMDRHQEIISRDGQEIAEQAGWGDGSPFLFNEDYVVDR